MDGTSTTLLRVVCLLIGGEKYLLPLEDRLPTDRLPNFFSSFFFLGVAFRPTYPAHDTTLKLEPKGFGRVNSSGFLGA